MIVAIVDTNIFISGLLCLGSPHQILDAWENNRFRLAIPDELLEELIAALDKPRLAKSIDEEASDRLISFIKKNARIVKLSHKIHACRDIKDNMVIETAIAAKADMIVSGDKDLLSLDAYRAIRIITPRKFIEMINAS